MRKEIEWGSRIPKYYGVAWHDHCEAITVCYPFPLNIIAGIGRSIYYRVRYFQPRQKYEKMCKERESKLK